MEYKTGDQVTINQIVNGDFYEANSDCYKRIGLRGIIKRKSELPEDSRYIVQFHHGLKIHYNYFEPECFEVKNTETRKNLINRIKERSKSST